MADPVHPYIRIREDGTIVAYSSQIEMGQGIHTGLATIVAEELDADFDSVRVVNAANGGGPPNDVYGNPDAGGALPAHGRVQFDEGVTGCATGWRPLRRGRGSWPRRRRRGTCPPRRSRSRAASSRHASGRQATFGELAARAEQLPVPDGVEPKDPADYKLIGREGRLRVDSVPKILGTTHFTIDLSLPGMLTAVVLHPPRFGATVASVDDQAALAEPGVTAVVPIDEGVAVVGETVADAQRGLRALVVEWDDANAERRSTAELLAEHVRLARIGREGRERPGTTATSTGPWPTRPRRSTRRTRCRTSLTPRWSRTTRRAGCARTACSTCGRAPNRPSTCG